MTKAAAPKEVEVQQPTAKEMALARFTVEPQALIKQAIESGSGVEVLERLVALAQTVQADMARRAWYDAMAEFQRTCPPVIKNAKADVGGKFTFTYATLDEIMSIISPVLGPLGLSVSYRMTHEPQRVLATCRISHEMGHYEESGAIPIPIEQGSMGATAAQRVGIAASYAKRYSLLAITGIAPAKEEEGGGGPHIEPPRRSSAPAQQPPPAASAAPAQPHIWVGPVTMDSKTKTGKTQQGKPWTLYTIIGSDGSKFGTFDHSIADFARTAGDEPVRITWEPTEKGSLKIVSIDFANREPGDEGASE